MQFSFDITSTAKPIPPQPQLPPAEMVPHLLSQMLEMQRDQLNQILEVQKAHLHHVRAMAHDQIARWRHILGRWQEDHPELTANCKKAYPLLEKAYVKMMVTITEELAEQEEGEFESDFELQEFIDRYGMKVGQLSHILSVLGPMTEAAQQNEAAKQQQVQNPG